MADFVIEKKVEKNHKVYEILYAHPENPDSYELRKGIYRESMIRMDYSTKEVCEAYLLQRIQDFCQFGELEKTHRVVLVIQEVHSPVVWLALADQDFKHRLMLDR